jgi:hypothetical protein
MPAYEATATLNAIEHVNKNAKVVTPTGVALYTATHLGEGVHKWCGTDGNITETIVGVLMPTGDEMTVRAS